MYDNQPEPPPPFNPAAQGASDTPLIPLDEFLPIARRQERDGYTEDTFRALCRTAIEEGIVSSQDLERHIGPGIVPRKLEELAGRWSLPGPDTCRKIISFFTTLDPEAATGNKRLWRHSRYAPPAAMPKLPD